jgi:23S rRNA pseudouridine2605 synthase
VSGDSLQRLRDGVKLDDGRTSPARVRRLDDGLLEIAIKEGRKRQVRRMVEAVGHKVTELERVRFGPLSLGELPLGRSRRLRPDEVARLAKKGGPG